MRAPADASTHYSRARGAAPRRPRPRSRSVRVVDQFCGAGGFSEAVRQALEELGLEGKVSAFNHDDAAIRTHNANHEGGEKADLYDLDPLACVPEGELDLLVASPTCTFFSRARGGKPVSWDQRKGRLTPSQVLRWAKALKPSRLIVENVEEFQHWGPVSRKTGKARRERRGTNFRQWVKHLRELGYRVEWRVLNAADFGDATTRRRFFLMARLDGKPIVWPEPTHAKTGPYGSRFRVWRGAREIINWSRRGRSIFSRKKPLAAKTLLRIYAGIVRFGWPAAYRIKLARYMTSLGIAVPDHGVGQRDLFGPLVGVLRRHADARSVDAPLPAVTAGGTHLGVVEPLILNRHGDNGGVRAQAVDEPLPTATTRGAGYVVEPFILSQGAGGAPRAVGEPVPTIPTEGAHALITAFYGNGGSRSVEDPLPTATTRDRFALVTPVTHADASMRSRDVADPLPTITGAHRGELGFVVGAFGERPGQTPRVHSIDEPAPTICAQGRVPFVQGVDLEPEDVDILFRMLEPDELAAAMGFPAHYRWPGNKTQRTRQVGNAVAVGVARALVTALMADWLEAAA